MGFTEQPASHSANKTRNGQVNYMRLKQMLPVVDAGLWYSEDETSLL